MGRVSALPTLSEERLCALHGNMGDVFVPQICLNLENQLSLYELEMGNKQGVKISLCKQEH